MPESSNQERLRERTLLLGIFALLLFASPFTLWWASGSAVWYLPYLLWFVTILLGALIHLRYGRGEP